MSLAIHRGSFSLGWENKGDVCAFQRNSTHHRKIRSILRDRVPWDAIWEREEGKRPVIKFIAGASR